MAVFITASVARMSVAKSGAVLERSRMPLCSYVAAPVKTRISVGSGWRLRGWRNSAVSGKHFTPQEVSGQSHSIFCAWCGCRFVRFRRTASTGRRHEAPAPITSGSATGNRLRLMPGD